MEEAAAASRTNWTAAEEAALIEMEVQLDPSNPTAIIDHLTANSTRSRDSIKKRRQLRTYREAVRVAREAPRRPPLSSSAEYESAEESVEPSPPRQQQQLSTSPQPHSPPSAPAESNPVGICNTLRHPSARITFSPYGTKSSRSGEHRRAEPNNGRVNYGARRAISQGSRLEFPEVRQTSLGKLVQKLKYGRPITAVSHTQDRFAIRTPRFQLPASSKPCVTWAQNSRNSAKKHDLCLFCSRSTSTEANNPA